MGYTNEEEESSLDSSYHLPTVAQDEPLLIFGSPAIEEVPILLSLSCGCPTSATVYIEDDEEMTAVPVQLSLSKW